MPLYIKDPDVSAMAERLQKLTRAPSKTEAVRAALQRAIDTAVGDESVEDLLKEAFKLADRIGPANPDFDQKAYSDEMWKD